MLFPFKDDGTRLPIVYNGLTFNSASDVAESLSQAPEFTRLESYAGQTAIDYIKENNERRDGIEVYNAHKLGRIHRLNGTMGAPTLAKLADRITAFAAAFDPSTIAFKNSDPFLPLTFSVPTNDTANYVSGLIPCQYHVLPIEMPEPVISTVGIGFGAKWGVTLLAKDPRRFAQSTGGRTGAGSITNLGDFRSWPTLTITMSGAGNAAYAYTNTGPTEAKTLTLNLSGLVNTNVVTVDCERRTISVGTTLRMDLYVSGDYPQIQPGSNTVAIANTSNTTTVTTYRPAWSL